VADGTRLALHGRHPRAQRIFVAPGRSVRSAETLPGSPPGSRDPSALGVELEERDFPMMRSLRSVPVLVLALLAAFAGPACDTPMAPAPAPRPTPAPTPAPQPTAPGARSGEVTRAGTTWTARVNGATVFTGTDMISAVEAAINGLTPGRQTKETVNIRNSGSTGGFEGPDVRGIRPRDFTILDFHGTTLNVNDTGQELVVGILARRVNNFEVRNLVITGNPRYGIWVQTCTDIVLSNIMVNIPQATQLGLGIRVDNARGGPSRNLTIDRALVMNTRENGVETFGVDGFRIGRIQAINTGSAGLLLNDSRNGTVDEVIGDRNNMGGGFATFRVANNNGPNVRVRRVVSRNSGRGFFSVSGSRGTTIEFVDIANTTKQGIFLEDASDTRVLSGTVSGGNPNCQLVRTTSSTLNVQGCNLR
jgi:hypothetical protein